MDKAEGEEGKQEEPVGEQNVQMASEHSDQMSVDESQVQQNEDMSASDVEEVAQLNREGDDYIEDEYDAEESEDEGENDEDDDEDEEDDESPDSDEDPDEMVARRVQRRRQAEA